MKYKTAIISTISLTISLCALILSETLALYKSFTYLLTYLHSALLI